MRSAILIASSTSWVTNTIVFADLLLQPEELVLEPLAADGVDRAERLVHEHDRRVGRQRARHADALTLAAGELARIAPAVGRRLEADEVEQLIDPASDAIGGPAQQARDDANVLADGEVREEPDLLDDIADAPPQLDRRQAHTSSPPMVMRPLVGSISRLTIFMLVVLPQPDGPTRTQISPAGTSGSGR